MARFGHELRQSQRQEMLLLPRMLQAIEILQLPALELDQFLQRAAEDNEALEVHEPVLESIELARLPRERRGSREATDRHDEMLQQQPARAKSVAERVEEELAMADLEPNQLAWVRLLVGCLDADGYLRASDDELLSLAREQGLEGGLEELAGAIARLQRLEPRGIGARNAIEALLLQIDPRDPDYRDLCALIEGFLEELAKNKLPSVARAMGLELGELKRLIQRLHELDPRPAAELDLSSAPVLAPDVVVERGPNGFEISLDGSRAAAVSLDESVRDLARDRAIDAQVRRYLRGKLERARWIVEAVEQRRSTLLRVATAVFDHQRAFLERGPGHLHPLRMSDLANELGLHVSTVSRAVSGKYAQTPWGILALRHLFQATGGNDSESARDDVRDEVRKLFESEDRARPLSDDDAVSALGRRGWKLARRTVTKYRKELGIPSSYRRKLHGE
jgi:RNA polymerase sigma-54 factor